MKAINVINRETGNPEKEQVYGSLAIDLLYSDHSIYKWLGAPLRYLTTNYSFFSYLFGLYQDISFSKRKIEPFIKTYQIDTSEFLKKTDEFISFNDFFTRKLKPECRQINSNPNIAVIPADGRYLCYQSIDKADGFVIKEEKFQIDKLLNNNTLVKKYTNGSMVIARLCPTDYHRFHFPCDCTPGISRFIHGFLYSVNPKAIKHNIHIFTENKRTICELKTNKFGRVLFIEIGATNVGSINQTYHPNSSHKKGDEKGYFSFGASSLILLFEPNTVQFDKDLLKYSENHQEVKCKMGQSLGVSTHF